MPSALFARQLEETDRTTFITSNGSEMKLVQRYEQLSALQMGAEMCVDHVLFAEKEGSTEKQPKQLPNFL